MPPFCEKHQKHYEMAYVDGMPWKSCVCVCCEFEKCSDSILLPQAPETTEILNEVGADKGILTEEELNKRYKEIDCYLPDNRVAELLDSIIISHRELFAANAELSFKNMKYKEILNKLDAHMDFGDQMRSNEVMVFEDESEINQTFKEAYRMINPEQAAINEALEELK